MTEEIVSRVWLNYVGLPIGCIAAVITFLGVYLAAVDSVGWVIGIALGWIPSSLAAWLAFWIFRLLWPFLLVGVGYVLWKT